MGATLWHKVAMSPQARFTMVAFHSLILFFLAALVILWRRPGAWLGLLMSFLGAFIGLSNLHSDEPIGTAFLLLAIAAFAGFVQPKRAWLWAVLLAVFVPAVTVLAMAANAVPTSPVGALNLCFAFVPALIGAAVGVGLNHAAGSPVLRLDANLD